MTDDEIREILNMLDVFMLFFASDRGWVCQDAKTDTSYLDFVFEDFPVFGEEYRRARRLYPRRAPDALRAGDV